MTTNTAALVVVLTPAWVISWIAGTTRTSVEKLTIIPTAPTPTNQPDEADSSRVEIFEVCRSPTVGRVNKDRMARNPSRAPEASSDPMGQR